MHKIVKTLRFCYGHRLLDYSGKCSQAHGHNAVVEVELRGNRLDERGMVCDFGEVKSRLMEFIEADLDHKMILRRDDPLVGALRSVGESPYTIGENPTAENIARLIFNEARRAGLPVDAVRLWETETCHAEYREEEGGTP